MFYLKRTFLFKFYSPPKNSSLTPVMNLATLPYLEYEKISKKSEISMCKYLKK